MSDIYDNAIGLIRKRTPSANNSLLIKTLQTAKAQEDKLEALNRDVARFIQLTSSDDINSDDWQEYLTLKEKLLKVGKEE